MLLTLIRLTMIVPLLVSAVCVEANLERLPFVPSEKENKVVAQSQRRNDAFLKEDERLERCEDSDLEEDEANKNDRYYDDQDVHKVRHGNAVENRFPRSGGRLANKMAKDALKSPKVQETINKLSHVASAKGKSRGIVKGSGLVKSVGRGFNGKGHRNEPGHKGRRKKKRKRHHRRLRKLHPAGQKGGSSKRTSDNERGIRTLGTGSNREESLMIKRSETCNKSTDAGSDAKITAVKVDNDDYLDFSTPTNTELSVFSGRTRHSIHDIPKLYDGENMIENLMKTTTRDPSKKSPGDQGAEYTDYYSDHEYADAIKIPIESTNLDNSNDRFVRQALNFTSHNDRNKVHRSNRYYRDYDPRRKERRYSGASLNDFQNYQTVDRSSPLRRRYRVTDVDDPSQNYLSNYGLLPYQNENPDTSYPINMDRAYEQSPGFDGSNELKDNVDIPDTIRLDNEIQQPSIEAQNIDQFNSLKQYDNSQERTVNINEGVEPKIPHFPSVDNYESADMNVGQGENFDAGMINPFRMDDVRIPNANEDIEPRVQPNYSPIPTYNYQEQPSDQISNNFPVQTKFNLPPANLPNAMNQPLGKVLESLGINVNDALRNQYQNSYVNEHVDHPIPVYYNIPEHPKEHVISPSYIKKKTQDDLSNFYETNSARGFDNHAIGSTTGNRLKENHSRRELNTNLSYNNTATPPAGNDSTSTQNVNISMAVHDTKKVAGQILDTIMEELEELKTDHSKNNKREGLPCRLSGSWSTAQAGMKLDMRVVNRSIIVTLSDLTSPRFHASLLNGTWNVSGHAPFKRGSPFTLIATDNNTNSMAVFVGACRICQGVDTIAGVWSVARQPKDCRDFQVSTSVFNDIFRKSQLSSLKEKQDKNTTEVTTPKHEKRKS